MILLTSSTAAAAAANDNDRYSSRFKVVIGFSLFVLIAMLSIFVVRVGFRYSSAALEYFAPNSLITLYFVLLSFFFLPSSRADPNKGMRDAGTTSAPDARSNRELQEIPEHDSGRTVRVEMDDNDSPYDDDEQDYQFDDSDMYASTHRMDARESTYANTRL